MTQSDHIRPRQAQKALPPTGRARRLAVKPFVKSTRQNTVEENHAYRLHRSRAFRTLSNFSTTVPLDSSILRRKLPDTVRNRIRASRSSAHLRAASAPPIVGRFKTRNAKLERLPIRRPLVRQDSIEPLWTGRGRVGICL